MKMTPFFNHLFPKRNNFAERKKDMARPEKAGLDYFPMDSDFYCSPIMRMILRSHGKAGVAFLLCLKAEIFHENGIYLTLDEAMLCKLEVDTDTDRKDILDYVENFIERGVFHRELYEKYNILTSAEIQRVYSEAVRHRAKKRRICVPSNYWLLSPEETPEHIDAGNKPPLQKCDHKKSENMLPEKSRTDIEKGGMRLPEVRCISDEELEERKREMIRQLNEYYADKD